MPLYDEDLSDDPENPDPSDMDSDDYAMTIRCPHCRKFIDEQSEVCPRCGYYLSVEDQPKKRSIWMAVAIFVAFLAIIYGFILTLHFN